LPSRDAANGAFPLVGRNDALRESLGLALSRLAVSFLGVAMRWADRLPPRQGYPTKYPWPEIAASGHIAVLVQGDDFDGPLTRPVNAAYDWAKRWGYRVESRTHPAKGEVFIKFTARPREAIRKAKPPTWIDRWVSSGGGPRGLGGRLANQAASWADKHDFVLSQLPDGTWRIAPRARSAFREPGDRAD
jgi:hypothetical protein